MIAMKPPACVVGDGLKPKVDVAAAGACGEATGKPGDVVDQDASFGTVGQIHEIAKRREPGRDTCGRTDEMSLRQMFRRQGVEPCSKPFGVGAVPDCQGNVLVGRPMEHGFVGALDDRRRGVIHRATQDSNPVLSAAASRLRPITTNFDSRISWSFHGLPVVASMSMWTP